MNGLNTFGKTCLKIDHYDKKSRPPVYPEEEDGSQEDDKKTTA